ncbi:MAG: Rpn family recombination-promoting nuclease/putative transposase, partial [Fibromonadales bacterium]|nr:Rpn family recombination-promoting nuclease/putative transposase [Fibromonadales bacterium]
RYPHIHIALVMLTRFKKRLEECKTTCDLWLYLFKNLHKMKKIPPKFRSKRWRSVFDVAKISNFNEIELRSYEANMKYCNDYENTIECAKKEALEEGEARGEKRGILKGWLEAAKAMLKDGLSPAHVARITKLPKGQVLALK